MPTEKPEAMSNEMPEAMRSRIHACGVVAVLVIDQADDAVPLARCLLEGGVDIMELTLRTPAAVEAIRRIRGEVPEMLVGAGTVLTPAQVREVAGAGAAFAVAPGLNPAVVAEAGQAGLPFAPGVMTPSEIERAVELGCRVLKFFPAEAAGGLAYLKNVAAPYQHLGLTYMPLGGVSQANARPWLQSPLTLAVGGSWIAKRDAIRDHDWEGIGQSARAIRALVQEIRGGAGQ